MHHSQTKHPGRPLYVALIALAALLGFAISFTAVTIYHMDSSIQSLDVSGYVDEQPASQPEKIEPIIAETPEDLYPVDEISDGDLNYLLLGSDSREGDNSAFSSDEVDSQRSDVTLIIHVSADRSRIDVVSIPRDIIVDIPECVMSDGTTRSALTNGQFNAAFSRGDTLASSIGCTIRTVQSTTGVEIDGFAVIDFESFVKVIDGLGGVTIDVPEDMVAAKAKLNVKEGEQNLDGVTALAYARARTFEVGSSQGSDLERIERQQQIMEAISDKVLSSGTLANPASLYALIKNTTDSVTVSEDIDTVREIASLGYSLRNVTDVNFMTSPAAPWSQNRNRLIWTDEAYVYWDKIISDEPLTQDESPEIVISP